MGASWTRLILAFCLPLSSAFFKTAARGSTLRCLAPTNIFRDKTKSVTTNRCWIGWMEKKEKKSGTASKRIERQSRSERREEGESRLTPSLQ